LKEEKKESKEEAKVEEKKEEAPAPAGEEDWLAECDTEEEKERERLLAKRAEENAKLKEAKGKKKEVAKSTLILDVKPEGEEIGACFIELLNGSGYRFTY
jgi:hypothetical protein